MFRELANQAKKIDVKKLVQQVVKSNAGLISDNVREQLSIGESGDGGIVGIYSSVWYAKKKARTSKASFGVVDLKLSGNLYKGLTTTVTEKKVTTDSSVDYSKYQINRYGKKIYDNTKKNQEKVSEVNTRQSVRNYKRALGL